MDLIFLNYWITHPMCVTITSKVLPLSYDFFQLDNPKLAMKEPSDVSITTLSALVHVCVTFAVCPVLGVPCPALRQYDSGNGI